MTAVYVKSKIIGAIAYIEFSNPPHNALPSDLLAQLCSHIQKLDANMDVKALVFQSAGDRTFCSGASLNELIHIDSSKKGYEFFMGFANVINALRSSSKLTIGRIQGKSVGGGVGLIAATDYCFATTAAQVKLSELSIGIGPFVIEPAVSRKIGVSAMTQLALNPHDFFSSEWALSKGLFNSIHPGITELDVAIDAFTNQLKSHNLDAITALKKVLWKDTCHWNELLKKRAQMSGDLVLSDFVKQMLKAYK